MLAGRVALGLILFSSMTASAAPAVPTRRDNTVETLHGVKVADPYRWLEDDASPEVAAWTDAENAHTRHVLDAIPGRAELEARMWSLHEVGSLGAPVPRPAQLGRARGWRYFYTRRDGKQNQPVLYVREGLGGIDRALVDVNELASDGTRALDWWFPSEDGRLVAYGVSADGNEESVLRVRDVATGRDLPDTIARTRACSLGWLPDASGFYYTRYPMPGSVPSGEESYHRQVFLHLLGAAPDTDPLIFGAGRDLKDWPSVALSPDGRFVGIEVSQGWSKNELYVLDRAAGPSSPSGSSGTLLSVAVGEDALFDLSEITNDAVFVRTNEGAPRYRLVRVPLPRKQRGSHTPGTRSPGRLPGASRQVAAEAPATGISELPRSSWREIVPEGPRTLEQVALIGKTLVTLYLEDASSRVRLFDIDGRTTGDVALPTLGSVGGLYGHPQGTELFLPFTSFSSPTTILRQALDAPAARAAARGRRPVGPPGRERNEAATPPVGANSAPPPAVPAPTTWRAISSPITQDAFVVTQSRARSKDGTEIPLFLVHRKDVIHDGNAPTLLYGYGGFNVNITPGWTPSVVPFLEKGGVYALAVLRGGGEYGEGWHQAGMLGHKQNVFDDFIAAATFLVATRVTRPERLAIMGRSNGGLLVGAALTERPDLFRAVVCGVPLLDMLRYHRFRIAQLWIPEYGSADDAEAFRWLHAYSPYHNVHDGVAYPAVLLATAASDTRVDPLHARKMTARLQAATASSNPILLRLETQAGHGAGKPLAKVIAQLVDEWSFLFQELGVPIRQ